MRFLRAYREDSSREKGGGNIMNHHKCILLIVLFIFVLIPSQINAWWPFGPSNFDDCILKYQKEAKCERASILINLACKCKFDPFNCPSDPVNYSVYSSAVWDCILDNIGNAQNNQAAVGIAQACISKYNK
jgi:hypothetical protein